jgi:hypothetical protein
MSAPRLSSDSLRFLRALKRNNRRVRELVRLNLPSVVVPRALQAQDPSSGGAASSGEEVGAASSSASSRRRSSSSPICCWHRSSTCKPPRNKATVVPRHDLRTCFTGVRSFGTPSDFETAEPHHAVGGVRLRSVDWCRFKTSRLVGSLRLRIGGLGTTHTTTVWIPMNSASSRGCRAHDVPTRSAGASAPAHWRSQRREAHGLAGSRHPGRTLHGARAAL